jgi:hypothetical protein
MKPVKRQGFALETYVAPHRGVNVQGSCGQNNVVDLSSAWWRRSAQLMQASHAAGTARRHLARMPHSDMEEQFARLVEEAFGGFEPPPGYD